MKHRSEVHNRSTMAESAERLSAALAALKSVAEVDAFLTDILTPAEYEALADRWRVVPLLKNGMPYREIHDTTGVSVTTIGRIKRAIEFGSGGYDIAWDRVSDTQRVPT